MRKGIFSILLIVLMIIIGMYATSFAVEQDKYTGIIHDNIPDNSMLITRLDELEVTDEKVSKAVVAIEAFTIGGGYLVEPTYVDLYNGETAAETLLRVLDEHGYTYSHWGTPENYFYLAHIMDGHVYQLPVDMSRVPDILLENLAVYGFDIDGYRDYDNSLGEFDYTNGSGWMYCVNNYFPDVGFSDYYLNDGDVMRVQFTLAYGMDIGGSYSVLGPLSEDFYQVNDKDDITVFIANYLLNYGFIPQEYLDIVSNLEGIENDTGYVKQWHIPYVKADKVWDISKGSGVTVAVIDNGFQLDHVALSPNIRINDYMEFATDTNEDEDHGTHVAGIIAAPMNGIGITGIAPEAEIIPIGAVVGMGGGVMIEEAINYAIEKGCKIVNMSFSQNYNSFVESSIQSTPDILFVASAGNGGLNTSSHYPSGYNAMNLISVANMQSDGTLNPTSNHTTKVHIAAPGTSIYSSTKTNAYGYKSGTSQATPIVSGVAALVASKYSYFNGADLKQIILDSSTYSSSFGSKVSCKGYVDAENAMNYASTYVAKSTHLTEVKSKKLDKSTIDLDDYVYDTQRMYIQFKDNINIEEALFDIQETIGINLTILRYNDSVDYYYIELDELLTRDIVQSILEFEEVTYAISNLFKVIAD